MPFATCYNHSKLSAPVYLALTDENMYRWKSRWFKQTRQWRQRRLREEASWSPLLDTLTDRLLRWKYPAPNPPSECLPSTTKPTTPCVAELPFTEPNLAVSQDDAHVHTHAGSREPIHQQPRVTYHVKVYDLFTLQDKITIFRPADSISPALDLLEHGYLARTPRRPEVAVSIKTLDLLYRLRQRKASFSIEAFAKVVCDYYMVRSSRLDLIIPDRYCVQIPYHDTLRRVFADTFDVYLRITRIVEQRLHTALGWDTPDWRPLNACRACCYKV